MKTGGMWFVDVEDVARLHAVALLDDHVEQERIIALASPIDWTRVVACLRTLRPKNTSIPPVPPSSSRAKELIMGSSRALQLLQSFFGRSEWTALEDSLSRGIESLEQR